MTTGDKVIEQHLKRTSSGWSIGVFGAIAEFVYDADEATEFHSVGGRSGIVTKRGGIAIGNVSQTELVAFETLATCTHDWSQSVAFCLSQEAANMPARKVLTELGPDKNALRKGADTHLLFDMGMDSPYLQFCVRTGEEQLIERLRAAEGRSIFDPPNPIMANIVEYSPNRIAVSCLGRVEVYQPIPAADGTGQTPLGPHTHVLPQLLKSKRTHAATSPIPEGLVPCLMLYPEHPTYDKLGREKPFDRGAFDAFQILLQEHGNDDFVTTKARTAAALEAGSDPVTFEAGPSKWHRNAARIALRQAAYLNDQCGSLDDWLRCFENGSDTAAGIMPGEGPAGEALQH